MNKSYNTGDCSTGNYSTGDCSTGHCSTGDGSTGNRSTGHYSTGDCSTGHCSTGDGSTGDRSTGDGSTGNGSTGNRSTGHYSTGDCSTGHCSTGDGSTGDRSTGDWSTGNRSTGDWSTGNGSTGNRSTGDWSTGDYSTGHFSTIDYSGFGAFNKPCTLDQWDSANKPDWFYFDLTEWVDEFDMTDDEKSANDQYKVTGGYLRVYDYKEAWRKAFDSASDEERRKVYNLPNWDNEIFKEITGIDMDYELSRKSEPITIDGKEYSEETVKKALQEYVA